MVQPSKFDDRLSWVRGIFLFNPLIYTYTIVLGTLSLISSLFDRSGRIQHGFARLWSWLILKTIMSPVRVTGLDRIDTSRPAVYASNHISALDIPVLYVHLPFQFRIMAKKELFRYPFMGWHLKRSGQVPIERENAIASIRALNRASESLKAGMPLVVFPEGGRSATGQVQPFMPGAFYVAIKAQRDVVPIALVGTYELLPMNTYHIKPRTLEMVVGEPISTAGYTTKQMNQLAAKVQKAVEGLYYARSEVHDPRAASTKDTATPSPNPSRLSS
ncbi:MAG TPA: lysophospholipid acyltransferase family protein [Terriglobales bacterium]|nr:lysophospholipid acyltransferase family protein [Terriglobales bacterium]